MSTFNNPYDVTREAEVLEPLDYNRRSRLKHFDKVFVAEVTNVIRLTEQEKLFHIRLVDPVERERFAFLPGQFVMVEVPGYGEVPISISSSTSQKGFIELCIRNAGQVTGILHRAKRGARLGIRGPFGSHFPMEKMKGHHVLLIAGGLGLAPLRAPIFYVTENRADFKDVHILYGTSDPSQLLFDYQYEQWRRIDGVNLSIIVDRGDENWTGEVGRVTRLLGDITTPMDDTYAIVCGPPEMFKFVCN
ncbi:MAG: FAD/NAD(P)-binding protein, partial [Proteobacteria bacterium]|nr:FAD/NAD(P)-binding protein [Pseudomonadota bacterium]